MHLFKLPWPTGALEELGEQKVTLRVTLSYFIEPGPGQRGWKDKYRYASHGLRFDICGAHENESKFTKRMSRMIAEEDNVDTRPVRTSDTSSRWTIG